MRDMNTTRRRVMAALVTLAVVALGAVVVTGAGSGDPGRTPVETASPVSDHWGVHGDRIGHHHGDHWTDHHHGDRWDSDHHADHPSYTPRGTDHHDSTDHRASGPSHHGGDTQLSPHGPATPHHDEENLTAHHGPGNPHHGPHH